MSAFSAPAFSRTVGKDALPRIKATELRHRAVYAECQALSVGRYVDDKQRYERIYPDESDEIF